MNKIIFDKYLDEGIEDIIPLNLTLRQVEKNVPAPEFGMIIIERDEGSKDFTEIFKDFCFASLYIKKEVIHALQQIRDKCNGVLEQHIFNLAPDHIMRLEVYKHVQESSTS